MWWQTGLIIFGLALLEIACSVDNAVLNAKILTDLPKKYRRFFLFWGLIFSIIVVRGSFPFLLIWLANPTWHWQQVLSAIFNQDTVLTASLLESRSWLLMAGGVYLHLIFWSWFLTEEKRFNFLVGRFTKKHHLGFYLLVLALGAALLLTSSWIDLRLSISALIGFAVFFVADGLKRSAHWAGAHLKKTKLSVWSKLVYLEILDAAFVLDGIVGSFAFTMNLPLIILGSGLGALLVRQLTVRGLPWLTRWTFLKNGALFSILFLSIIMIAESFGADFGWWLAPTLSFVGLTIFMALSMVHWKRKHYKK